MKRTLIKRSIIDIGRPDALKFFLVGLAIASVLLLSRAGIVFANETAVATGDGFVVTAAEVDELKAFTAARSFGSTEEEFRRAALKLRLFSMEAEAVGLGAGASAGGQTLQDTVEARHNLYQRYVDKLVDEYQVPDIAIKSYYLANPEKFRKPVVVAPESAFYPLDAKLKEEIRKVIVTAKKPFLAEQAFERLKEKYHVTFPGKGSGK